MLINVLRQGHFVRILNFSSSLIHWRNPCVGIPFQRVRHISSDLWTVTVNRMINGRQI